MRALIFDYDGVLLRSERPKAAGWVLAALAIKAEVGGSLIDSIRAGDPIAAKAAFEWICRERGPAIKTVTSFAGLSREDTCNAVWAALLSQYRGPLGPEDLNALRTSIRDAILLANAAAIPGSVCLVQAASTRLHLGLVTHAKRQDVETQTAHFGIPLRLFRAIECCGDNDASGNSELVKTLAYSTLCRRLGAKPSEAFGFEDSSAGVTAAASAGIDCIGLRGSDNPQNLSSAKLVVQDLGWLATPDIIQMLVVSVASEAIDNLKRLSPANC